MGYFRSSWNYESPLTRKELEVVLREHAEWLDGMGGKRADLSRTNLKNAKLREVNLKHANLQYANLTGADVRGANLWQADLQHAILCKADFEGTELDQANLEGADLMGANLNDTRLTVTNLKDTNLSNAILIKANLYKADLTWATATKADFTDAIVKYATLYHTTLIRANFSGADLSYADLRYANVEKSLLYGTILKWADIRGADFKGAKGIEEAKFFPHSNLDILKLIKGKMTAYKVIDWDNRGTAYPSIEYKIGKIVKEEDYDSDERNLDSKGIYVAPLSWCKQYQNRGAGYKIIEVEFTAKDIVAIPYATDGEFRVKRCKVIREV